MTYAVRISGPAERYFGHLDRRTQARIRRRIGQIADDPYGDHSKQLQAANRLRASRVGGWGILFRVDDEAAEVTIRAIAPRGQAYQDL